MKRGLFVACALLPLAGAIAAEKEHEEHGAHEHGHGKFNVAIEGKTLAMELMSPGADIVGFEHEAKSAEDKKAVDKAKKILSDVAKVVELPAGAGCTLASVKVEIHGEGDHDDHDDHAHEKKHDDHAQKKKKATITTIMGIRKKVTTMTMMIMRTRKSTMTTATMITTKKKQKVVKSTTSSTSTMR